MQSPRFQGMAARFSPASLRTTFRRASSSASSTSSSRSSRASCDRRSYRSAASSPAETINSIVFGQPSVVGLQEERKIHGSELNILEPRPVVYWGSVEERMATC